MGKKNIYKKSLAIELIKRGNDLCHTMRNYKSPSYQVYVFKHTKKLDKDIAELTNKEYIPDDRAK